MVLDRKHILDDIQESDTVFIIQPLSSKYIRSFISIKVVYIIDS